MATIIFTENEGATNSSNNGDVAIRVSKGDTFFAKFMTPNGVEDFAEIEHVGNGSTKITAKMDIIAVVEGIHESLRGCKHIRFVRADRKAEGAQGLNFVRPKAWPRLRVALGHAGLIPVHVAGGFPIAVCYTDEIAVPNYSMAGSSGWIILRKDIGKHLDALPPLVDSGEIAYVWVDSVGYTNTPDECSIQVMDHDPTNDDPPSYYDRPRGYQMSSNRQIFRVEFDKGSRVVKRIVHLRSDKKCDTVGYKVRPVARNIEVGRRLPRGITA